MFAQNASDWGQTVLVGGVGFVVGAIAGTLLFWRRVSGPVSCVYVEEMMQLFQPAAVDAPCGCVPEVTPTRGSRVTPRYNRGRVSRALFRLAARSLLYGCFVFCAAPRLGVGYITPSRLGLYLGLTSASLGVHHGAVRSAGVCLLLATAWCVLHRVTCAIAHVCTRQSD